MPTPDRDAVDGRDHGLRNLPDQPVQALDLEQTGLARAVVAGLRALLLIAAGAEGPVAGAGQADHADLGRRPRAREQMDQLVDRPRPEGVHPVGPVDRDPGQAVLDFVAGVGQIHPSLLCSNVKATTRPSSARR